MDGRWYTAFFLLLIPIAGMAATVVWFNSNPVAILVGIATIILGSFYLLTYSGSFA